MTDTQALAENVVRSMMEKDAMSAWLGIKLLEVSPGRAKIQMTVRQEMANGFGVAHGGIAFSFADSAFAFASNTHGRISMSINNEIAYFKKVLPGDVLIALAEEKQLTNSLGFYDVSIKKSDGSDVGLFHGTVYRTKKEFFGKDV